MNAKEVNSREELMRKIAEKDFALIDIHLYLDTHPNDVEMSKKQAEIKKESEMLRKEYEDRYGPISMTSEGANRWAWITNPWPWDTVSEREEK